MTSYYPAGRKIYSIAWLQVNGTGSNANWLIKKDVAFLYVYRVEVETEVTKNDGVVVDFVQHFREVVQQRFVGRHTFQLDAPSPITKKMFDLLDKHVLSKIPYYADLKEVKKIADVIDPDLKRTLTRTADLLGLNTVDPLDIAVQFEKLQGTALKLEYVSGIGVTNIDVLNAPKNTAFSEADLTRLAYGSSLLMDYYIFPGAKKNPAPTWGVDAQQVAGLFNLYDATISGTANLRREPDEVLDGTPVAVLRVLDGKLDVVGDVASGLRSGTLEPKPGGTIYFSPTDLFVRRANVSWHVSGQWDSPRSLFFGTKSQGNVEVTTVYEAERKDNGGRKPAAKPDQNGGA